MSPGAGPSRAGDVADPARPDDVTRREVVGLMGAGLMALGLPGCADSGPLITRRSEMDLGAVFDAHVKHEFVDKDVEATMLTMTPEPYVWNVPTMLGGMGAEGVRRFYTDHFVGKMPPDTKVVQVSRTVGVDRVVDELVLSFTHDRPVDFMLPGIAPTGRHVEVPHVVVMKFENGRIAHEHIYWDQASVLAQVGLLDPAKLPVTGGEQARKLLDGSLKSRG